MNLVRLTDLCFRGLSQAAGLISLGSQEVKSEKDFSLSLAFLAMTDKRFCDLWCLRACQELSIQRVHPRLPLCNVPPRHFNSLNKP